MSGQTRPNAKGVDAFLNKRAPRWAASWRLRRLSTGQLWLKMSLVTRRAACPLIAQSLTMAPTHSIVLSMSTIVLVRSLGIGRLAAFHSVT
jgi:hypothetical protein